LQEKKEIVRQKMSRYLSMLFIFQYLFRVCQSCAQRCCVE